MTIFYCLSKENQEEQTKDKKGWLDEAEYRMSETKPKTTNGYSERQRQGNTAQSTFWARNDEITFVILSAVSTSASLVIVLLIRGYPFFVFLTHLMKFLIKISINVTKPSSIH